MALTAVTAMMFAQTSVTAEEPRPPRHFEVFAGVDAAKTVWLVYSGATLAPFGDIHEEGLRLRASGGYGQYRYQVQHSQIASDKTTFHAQASYAEALIGYLKRFGPLTAKGFVGFSAIEHDIRPVDTRNRADGLEMGAKVVAEFWLNIGDNAWSSLDLAWSQAHNTRSARSRIGYRVMPQVSIGLEAGLNIDRQGEYKITDEVETHRSDAYDYARVGAFARYDWYGGEISASAGLLGDFTEERSAYATLNWLSQF